MCRTCCSIGASDGRSWRRRWRRGAGRRGSGIRWTLSRSTRTRYELSFSHFERKKKIINFLSQQNSQRISNIIERTATCRYPQKVPKCAGHRCDDEIVALIYESGGFLRTTTRRLSFYNDEKLLDTTNPSHLAE